MREDTLFTAESRMNGSWSNPLRNARGRSRLGKGGAKSATYKAGCRHEQDSVDGQMENCQSLVDDRSELMNADNLHILVKEPLDEIWLRVIAKAARSQMSRLIKRRTDCLYPTNTMPFDGSSGRCSVSLGHLESNRRCHASRDLAHEGP